MDDEYCPLIKGGQRIHTESPTAHVVLAFVRPLALTSVSLIPCWTFDRSRPRETQEMEVLKMFSTRTSAI